MSIDVSTISTPDPKAALRQARMEALKQQVGRAFVRLAGEAWLTVADTHDQPF